MAPIQLLILMAVSSPIALNIYGPAMPDMVSELNTTEFHIQLGLTLYLLTLALGQFFAGPIADRFGRRPVLLVGFFLHALGGVLAIFATDVTQLLSGRVLQALGGCTGVLLTRSIILDSHGKDRAASLLGYITMAIAVSQAIAPTFGGYTNILWGWQSVIAVNIVLGVLVFAMAYLYLPEKEEGATEPFNLSTVLSKYGMVFRSRAYIFYAFSATLIAACFFAFLNSAPFIVRQNLGGDSALYGTWFLCVAGGFMLGSFSAGQLSSRLGTVKMVWVGNTVCFLSGVFMLCAFVLTELSLLSIFLPMACFTFGRGLSQPNAQSSALNCVRSATGTASGMLGFVQLLVGACVAQIAPMVFQHNVIALPIFLMVAPILAFICFWLGGRYASQEESA